MNDIRYFTILGERCSGTHFLQHAILQNFHLSYVKGEKHFFGNREFRNLLRQTDSANSLNGFASGVLDKSGNLAQFTTASPPQIFESQGVAESVGRSKSAIFGRDEVSYENTTASPPQIFESRTKMSLHEKQMYQIDAIPPNEILTICIVRDPVEWIDSFFKRKHHVPPENREPIERFLSSEFYSIYEEPPKKGEEIMEDRNWQTKERYRDLFELRRLKCQYLCDATNHTAGRYFFLRYEDLRDHYESTLETIQTQFQLLRKSTKSQGVAESSGRSKSSIFGRDKNSDGFASGVSSYSCELCSPEYFTVSYENRTNVNSKIYGGEAVVNSKICGGEAVADSKIYGGEAVADSKIYGGEAVANSKIYGGEAVVDSKIYGGEAVVNYSACAAEPEAVGVRGNSGERSSSGFIPTPKYKGTYHVLYEKKPVLLSDTIQTYIWENVDVEQESRMGYVKP